MKTFNSLKLWLLVILCASASVVSAQSVSISPGATSTNGKGAYFYCMPANNSAGTVFQATGANLSNATTTGTIELYTWTALGGIDIDGAPSGTASGASLSSVTVKPKTGTDYSPGQYSKYAKGKLKVTIRVKHSYEYTYIEVIQSCPLITQEKTATYTYYVNYPTEIEIRKDFSDLTGNEITGPECVTAGQRVTYSVAPWVSMYQLNTIGLDEYDWTIPDGVAQNGVLYYSADHSSVTFIVDNDFEGKTIAVRMGACNLPNSQTPVTLTLKATPGAPALSNGSFAQGLCIPLGAGQQTLTLTNADPNNTYIWENLTGWAATPTVTLGSNHTLTFTPQNDSRVLRLRVQGNCGEQVFDLQVNRTLSAGNNQIQAVSGSTCVAPNTVVQFMLTNVGNNVQRTWTITDGASNGWYILPNTETLAQPHIMTGTGSATISVVAAGCSGTPITGTFSVAPKVPVINSASPVCVSNAPQKFSVRQADATVTYEWNFPTGWTEQTSNANQSSITLIPSQTGGQVKVRAIGANNCISDWSDAIDVAAPLALSMITPCVDAGLSGYVDVQIVDYDPDIEYGFPTIDDATFGTIDSGGIDGSGKFRVNTTGKVGNFTVSVSATNVCGDVATASLPYTVAKDPFTVLETPLNIPGLQISSFMILDQGYQDFDWRGDGQSLATVSSTINYVTGTVVVSDYSSIYVTVTNSTTGCKTRKFRVIDNGSPVFRAASTNPNFNTKPKAVNEFTVVDIADAQDTDGQLTIFPNPASTELNINLSSEGNINICIVSMSGSIVKESANQLPNTTIDVSNLPTGTYIVVVLQGTNRYAKQFIKN